MTRNGVPIIAAIAIAVIGSAANTLQAGTDVWGGRVRIHQSKVYTIADEASRIVKNAEEQAYEIHDHAVTVQAGTMQPMDREFFAAELEAMKQDINTMGQEFGRLEALASFETSQEKQIVETAKPQLKTIAETTNAAIVYLNEHPGLTDMPAYRTLTATLRQQTGTLWQTLHDSVKLANVQLREEQLRKNLARTTEAER